jgi:predicted DCC family thiol-disulfide oxidoreductase YuxK
VPYQEAPSPPMTPELRAACERAAHVITADGRLLRAGRGCLFVLERLGWGWVARLLARPPFIWIVEVVYRIVADHRRFFARFLFRLE